MSTIKIIDTNNELSILEGDIIIVEDKDEYLIKTSNMKKIKGDLKSNTELLYHSIRNDISIEIYFNVNDKSFYAYYNNNSTDFKIDLITSRNEAKDKNIIYTNFSNLEFNPISFYNFVISTFYNLLNKINV